MKRISAAVLAALTLSLFILGGCSTRQQSKSESPAVTAAEEIPEVTETTVKTTGGKIHINDSTLGDIWITELEGVAKNELSSDGFTADSTWKYYSENGKPASVEGIDISSYSGEIDWEKVKKSGLEFVMVRLGGRGYGEDGALYADKSALDYIEGARNAGLKVGGYFFSQATTIAEAREEADYCRQILGDTKLDYPLAYDWEIIKDDDARTDSVASTEATECARAFCEQAKSDGFIPMIYSPSRELYFKYDLTRLSDFDIWYCEYADTPNFYYEFSMWQYSSTGKIDGIDGTVDLNIVFTNVADYA